MRFCCVPGCATLVPHGRCPAHAVAAEHQRANYDQRWRYRTSRWAVLAQRIKVDQGYACAQCGQVTPRLEIDHKVKHHGNPQVFWNRQNLQALCPLCHHQKTAQGQ